MIILVTKFPWSILVVVILKIMTRMITKTKYWMQDNTLDLVMDFYIVYEVGEEDEMDS